MAFYNCLLFDVDGTLLDFDAAERMALRQTLEQFHLPVDEETISRYHTINTELWQALEKGRMKKDKLVVQRFSTLLKELGQEGDPAAMNQYYLTCLSQHAIPYEGAIQLVKDLSEVATIAIISNGVERVQQGRLQRSGLDQLVDAVFVSEKLGVTKPNRKFFDAALNTLGINNRKKVLVIGDSLKADIQGGINAGLATCWCNFTGAENTAGVQPDFVIDNLSQLMQIVMEQEELDNVGNPTRRHLV
ncbi:noncanonical pyrimidine nucleotidase, YjjG family [Anaerofilum sp. An201]|nr:YjjG family noncanonical pyrimidine nucleotidase [Anaerofilum sp. An201]OUP00658.1 noncanonical pyrimidine nucleotidase, YjjG family [Anaerofilum sp. An201]